MILAASALHRENVVVQVAVAHMAETIDPEITYPRQQCRRFVNELGNQRNWNGNIVARD